MNLPEDWPVTVLYLAIFATVLYAAKFVYEFRKRLDLKGGRARHIAFFLALAAIGLLYVLDYVTEHQFTLFDTHARTANIADGHWLNFHVYTALITVGLIALGLMVTGRSIRALLAAVQDRERRFRAFFDNAPMSMSLKDRQGRYLLINKVHESWLGLPARDVIGKTMREIVNDPALTDNLSGAEKRVLETGAVHETTVRWQKADGKKFDWVVTKFPVLSPDGSVVSIGTFGVDVTEQMKAQAVVRASEARFSGIVDIASDAIIMLNQARRVTTFNKGAERIFGYAAADVIGQPLDMLIPERFRTGHDRQITAFDQSSDISRPMLARGEIAGRRKDGTEFPAEASISKLDLDGETVFTVFLRDITDHKQRETALRDSERNLRAILENSPMGVAIIIHTSDNGRVEAKRLFVNDALVRMFGGTDIRQMIESDVSGTWIDSDRFYAINETMNNGVDLVDFEVRRQRHDGTEFWVSMNSRPIRFDNQDCTMVWYFDITGRKQAGVALQESEARFRAVVDNSPTAISLKDADGQYLIVNKIFRKWLNLGESDLTGKTSHDFLPKEFANRISNRDDSVIMKGIPESKEEQRTFPDGVTRTTWSHKFPIFGPGGECTGVGTATLDVTDQRNTESQLRQAQKMEAVGQMTGGIAHDFNNLLGVIIGNLDFLAEELEGNAALLAFTESATKAALTGATLNRQLLAFSRKQSLSPQVIDLSEHLSGMMDMLRRVLGETVNFEAKQSHGPWTAKVDPAQLESAVLNLAVNARDAMPEGGTLTIHTRNVRLDDSYAEARPEVTPGEYVMLAVTDTGTGIAPENLAQIFEPFFTTKDVGKGSGLGLSMVFGFTKQSGGHVEIESEEGRGTTVTLFLPYARQTTAAAAQEETVDPPLARGESILVVEDDPELLKLAGNLLDGLGYRVLRAKDGASALAVLAGADGVDLLLTDVVMPGGMSGLALATEASARQSGIKVLYMSGHIPDTSRHQDRRDGNTPLLRKPFRKPELARMVRAALTA